MSTPPRPPTSSPLARASLVPLEHVDMDVSPYVLPPSLFHDSNPPQAEVAARALSRGIEPQRARWRFQDENTTSLDREGARRGRRRLVRRNGPSPPITARRPLPEGYRETVWPGFVDDSPPMSPERADPFLMGESIIHGNWEAVRNCGVVDHRLEEGQYGDWKTPESDPKCYICLEEYEARDAVLKLSRCRHWLHKSCLELWLKNANTCPVCRAKVA